MIRPIRNNVLVKCFEGNKVSTGGIIVADSFYTESNKVKVVATGKGTAKKEMKLKIGDIGHRVKSWGTPIEENGELFYLMEQDAIICLQDNN